MTTLQITPNFKSKTARFKGTVAAGEHVSVTIQNDDGSGDTYISDTASLRLRVVDPRNGATLAQFPEPADGDVLPSVAETETSWDEDVSPLRCVINLNTVQMLRAVPPAANVQLLVVLDDFENSTLYFKDICEMTHWPRRRGEEEPVDLDGYVDIVSEFGRRLSEAEATVESAAASAGESAQAAVDARDAASSAATAATDAQTGAIASKNAAQAAAQASSEAEIGAQQAEEGAQAAQAAAEDAQSAAETAQERAEEAAGTFSVDPTLSTEGVAADAKAAGDRIADVAGDVEDLATELSYETAARELLDGAMQVDRMNLANEISRAQGAEQSLESRKANKSEVYNKTEVDTKIAGVHAFKKYLVQTLPDADEADMGGLYLVPTGETSEEGDLCEEWTVVEEDGEKRWERIGATAVDLSDYYDKNAVDDLLDDKQDELTFDNAPTTGSNNPVKSGGIWSALWGTATTAFSSLYDWCVAQLVHKRDYTDRSYNTQVTVNAPALHATLTSRGTQILEYYLPCTEDIPATPAINHVYTWRKDGAEFYITQGVSVYSTTWNLFDSSGEQLATTTTDNATDGWFPDLTFAVSANSEVTTTKVNSYPAAIHDTLALNSDIPTSLPWSAITDKPQNFTPSAHASTHASNGSDPITPSAIGAVPTSRKVNDKALTNDVTLTGADIAVSGTDATKINAALAGKASTADATLTERFSAWTLSGDVEAGSQYEVRFDYDNEGTTLWGLYKDGYLFSTGSDNPLSTSEDFPYGVWPEEYTITATRMALPGYQLGSQTYKPLASEAEAEALRTGKANRAANPTAGNLAALDAQGNPTDSGVKAADKLDATSAAPAFSSDSSVSYAVGSHVTYNGKLYKCTTATTGGTWDASEWTADTMTDPDAVLDITSQNQLRVVAKDGTLLWAQGYDLASTSSATLACDATNNFTFADGATTQAFALPTAPTGKVGDFGLDIDNSANTGAATMTLTGLDTTFSVVVPEGESLNDMLAIAAGELARFYISLSTFRVNNLPTWHIVKQIVENGGATV